MRQVFNGLAILAVASFLAGPAFADEGMWTFDNFPAAAVKAKYGVTIDQAWLDHARLSTIRLSDGCSASIVSSKGLVLTNHHCVAGCAESLSTPQKDLQKDGFAAAVAGEERRCPGMQAEVLIAVQDVTDQIKAATAAKTGGEVIAARDAKIADLEKTDCEGKTAVQTCQVVTLYQGGRYALYTYRKYTDVRLVFAPEQQTAFFGGDPDNFNFPRYDLDISFLRLYVDSRPAATPTHLRWSASPPKDGEPTFVVGNPGTTNRLFTAEQLDFQRDVGLPQTLLQLSELRGRLIVFGEQGPETARIADGELFGVENSFKAFYGQLQALQAPGFLDTKRRQQADLVARFKAIGGAQGDPWADLAKAQQDRAGLDTAYTLLERRHGYFSSLFSYAVRLVRGAQERARPNAERLPEYADARLPLMEKQLLDPDPVYPALERLEIEFWLTKVREYLGADAPETKGLLAADSPEALAARLSTSTLGDPAVRKALWEGGLPAVMASGDPMIRYVLATDSFSRAARSAFEAKVSGPSLAAAQEIAAARFAVLGTDTYPDATFTPRISFGHVSGWTYQGKTVGPFTTFGGLWGRVTGQDPFALPARWIAARGKLNDATVFNFVTDNDIVGGNSGSPVLNAAGEVIGAAFDGNIYSLGGAFAFDPRLNRAVSVSTAATTEALRTVYSQDALVRELLAP